MDNSTSTSTTKRLLIGDCQVMLTFSENDNTDAEQAIGQLLMEEFFRKGCGNYETSQSIVSELNAKAVREAG